MINNRYKLISPRKINLIPTVEDIQNKIIVKPQFLSICAADQRYFFGKRNNRVLNEKLPLSLIHEAIGEVKKGNENFKIGDIVVLIPNIIDEHKDGENYNKFAKFMSSSIDGFLQEFVVINENHLLKINDKDYMVYVLTEIVSVAFHAINSIKHSILSNSEIVIWGTGTLAFCLHICLLEILKDIKITVVGRNESKLNFFDQAICKMNVFKNEIPKNFDIAFEAVGGESSSSIINTIIDSIAPEGKIVLLGVAEEQPSINTRMILEKGLTIIGRSRSTKKDFENAIKIIKKHKNSFLKLFSSIVEVNSIDDIEDAFNQSLTSTFKTIMKWKL